MFQPHNPVIANIWKKKIKKTLLHFEKAIQVSVLPFVIATSFLLASSDMQSTTSSKRSSTPTWIWHLQREVSINFHVRLTGVTTFLWIVITTHHKTHQAKFQKFNQMYFSLVIFDGYKNSLDKNTIILLRLIQHKKINPLLNKLYDVKMIPAYLQLFLHIIVKSPALKIIFLTPLVHKFFSFSPRSLDDYRINDEIKVCLLMAEAHKENFEGKIEHFIEGFCGKNMNST